VTGGRGRSSNKLPRDIQETKEERKLKKEALDRTLRRNRCRRGYGLAARQTAE